MKVSFNFDTGARRIRLRPEDELEIAVLNEMALLGTKGVSMQIQNVTGISAAPNASSAPLEFEISMRINGFDKEKKAE